MTEGDPATAGQRETARLLDALVTHLSRYVILNRSQYVACALWVMHTYCWQLADCTPYLGVTSAEMRSGKTRLIEALTQVVHNPYTVVSPTEAVLFRVIDQLKPTLLIDETDTMFKDANSGPSDRQEGIRAVINSGFRSSGYVSRLTPGLDLVSFSTFCPKLLAGIGHLPPTIEDRGLAIRLVRKRTAEEVERFRERSVKAATEALRADLAGWGAYAMINLDGVYPEMPEGLDDRAQDMFELLVSIGDHAGEEWGAAGRDALVSLRSGQDAGEPSRGVRLLEDLSLVDLSGYDRIPTGDLLALLYEVGEQPYEEWWGESTKPKAALRLAKLLREYGVKSERYREGQARRSGYRVAEIAAEVARYALNPGHPGQTADLQGFSEILTLDNEASVARVENPANPHGKPGVQGVQGSTPEEHPDKGSAWLSPEAQAELDDLADYP